LPSKKKNKVASNNHGSHPRVDSTQLKLDENSQVAVIGSGPAGSFFSYFLLDMAFRIGITIQVDIFESRDFSSPAPAGCNMCGGIVSESLVQALAAEGISLPPSVVQRAIESYTLHMDVGGAMIETPRKEKRIAAVHRGAGPRDIQKIKWHSFDGYLQGLAKEKGANLIHGRVDNIEWEDEKPQVHTKDDFRKTYDLLVLATGVNSATAKLFQDKGYTPPKTTKTFICEYYLGEETIETYLGNSMHAYLLNIPRMEFAAFIPKGDYATVCMLGKEIDKELVGSFLEDQGVKSLMPPNWQVSQKSCQCYPRINMKGAKRPFFDRVIFIGDCGVSRLYKDGIGAAYNTAKAASSTAIFSGISAKDFEKKFWPVCKKIDRDNRIGKMLFFSVGLMKKFRFARRAILRMVIKEQKMEGGQKRMSMALWDMLTGSAPYREVFWRMLHPFFLSHFLWSLAVEIWPFRRTSSLKEGQ
jgi:flavin-dependent dehydrogenase